MANTKVQRCIFHAFSQVKRYTTTSPRLPAGVELCALAKEPLQIKTLRQASVWLERHNAWCTDWAEFSAGITIIDGEKTFTHDRLIKARNGLIRLINQNVLFTFLDLELTKEGSLPASNNRLEDGVNAPLRQMLRDHRGLSDMRGAKQYISGVTCTQSILCHQQSCSRPRRQILT